MKLFLRLALILALVTPAHAGPFGFDGGGGHRSSSLARAMHDIGKNPTGRSRAWCGCWMQRIHPDGPGCLAASWARYNRPGGYTPGNIVVMPHHVAKIIRCEGSRCLTISGNHAGRSGHRTVGTGWYPKSRFIAVRAAW